MNGPPERIVMGKAPTSRDPFTVVEREAPTPVPFPCQMVPPPEPVVIHERRSPGVGKPFLMQAHPTVGPDGQVVTPPTSGPSVNIIRIASAAPTPPPPPRPAGDLNEHGLFFNGHAWTYAPELAAKQLALHREHEAAEARARRPFDGRGFRLDGGVLRKQSPTESRDAALAWEVSPDQLDARLVADCERTLRMASVTLGLARAPRLRWLPHDAPDRGVVFDSFATEIWVRPQSMSATKNTVLHELRHAWGLQHGRYEAVGLDTMEQRQLDADQFAASWTPSEEIKGANGERLLHKDLRGGVVQVKSAAGSWQISGYASTFGNVDRTGDVIYPGAFSGSIAAGGSKFCLEHHLAIGRPLSLREDQKGLFGTWEVLDTQAGNDALKLAKAGILDSLSIGYLLKKSAYRKDGARVITDVELLETSLVATPANPEAVVTGIRE